MRRFALVFALFPLANAALAQRIEVTPDTVVAGEPVRIVLKDLPRSAEITVVAERPVKGWTPGTEASVYRSQATFRTSHAGTLDLATAQPLSGSYEGADLRGLFWSMAPTGDKAPAEWPAHEVRLSARKSDATIARATLTLREAQLDVVLEDVDDEALPGAVLAKLPGDVKRPAIIVLGGSEGGDWFARSMAPRLASYGYAVLGVPYYVSPFSPRGKLEGLPIAFVDIPVDRLQIAHDWLVKRNDIDIERIGVYGVSKGAEFALIAATRFDWIDAVAAIVPSDVVWEGWGDQGALPGTRASFSWRGEALPFVPYDNIQTEFMRMGAGGASLRRPHDEGRARHPDRALAARIPVETYRGDLLVAAGMLDAVWGSGPMAQNIVERRVQAGLPTTAVIHYGAGHALSGHGWSPTSQVDTGTMRMGGTPRDTAHAQARTWEATLALFGDALKPPTDPTER